MSRKQQQQIRLFNNNYYKKVLLQFLGTEKEIFPHSEYSVKFYHNRTPLFLWMGANKIQRPDKSGWIENADEFIINNVLKDKNAPTIKQYQHGT